MGRRLENQYSGIEFTLIAEGCGTDVAELLIRQFGGRKLRIPAPEYLNDSSKLAKAVGWPIALKICKALAAGDAGIEITIPLGGTSLNEQRAKLIEGYLRNRKSINETARLSGSHVRTVLRHRARLKRDERAEVDRRFKSGATLDAVSRVTLFHSLRELGIIRAQIVAEKSLSPRAGK